MLVAVTDAGSDNAKQPRLDELLHVAMQRRLILLGAFTEEEGD